MSARFASDTSVAFAYDAAHPKRDSLALEAGLQARVGKNVSLYGGGSVQSGNRAEAWKLSGGIRTSW